MLTTGKMKLFTTISLLLHLWSIASYCHAQPTDIEPSNDDSKLRAPLLMKNSDNPYNKLKVCPDKPNCINTEYPDNKGHYRPPLSYPEELSDQVINIIQIIIMDMGGKIINGDDMKDKYYLHATFTSSIFKFVDDFEIRIDNLNHKIHIRSASRTGYSDFGVNKRRVEKFSLQFEQALKKI